MSTEPGDLRTASDTFFCSSFAGATKCLDHSIGGRATEGVALKVELVAAASAAVHVLVGGQVQRHTAQRLAVSGKGTVGIAARRQLGVEHLVVVDQLAHEYSLDDIDRAIIERYMELGPVQRGVIKDYIKSLTAAFADKVEAPAAGDTALAAIAAMQDYAKMVADEKEGGEKSSTSAG